MTLLAIGTALRGRTHAAAALSRSAINERGLHPKIVRVNGKETNRFQTNDMIFGVVPFLVELTKYFTLWPGDVIWMGTDGASPDIKHGDVVEIDITGVGTLRNRFAREER